MAMKAAKALKITKNAAMKAAEEARKRRQKAFATAMKAAKAPARPKPMKATKKAMKVAKAAAPPKPMKATRKPKDQSATAMNEFANNAMLKGMLIKISTKNVTEVLVNVWTEGKEKEIKYKWYLCYKR